MLGVLCSLFAIYSLGNFVEVFAGKEGIKIMTASL